MEENKAANIPARTYEVSNPHRGYTIPQLAQVDRATLELKSRDSKNNIVQDFVVPKCSGKAWELLEGQVCRISLPEGSQVGDINMWNLHDFKEHFYSGKTRQIHRSHLSTCDRLWSSLPYLRPMATITQDSLEGYGIDKDGAAVHDVIGTRCDPYTHKLMTGQLGMNTCHQNLTEAIIPWGLTEFDVHDVFNIFMCSAFNCSTHEYEIKASPARQGDYIEWIADVDLLVALSTCPQGDVSTPCGQPIPDGIAKSLRVIIGQPTI